MLSIPNSVKSLLLADGTRKNFRVHFPNHERADIINNNIVSESVSLTETLCSQDTLKYGLCESPYIEFEVFGVGNIKGSTIECSLEVDASSLYDYSETYINTSAINRYPIDMSEITAGTVIYIDCSAVPTSTPYFTEDGMGTLYCDEVDATHYSITVYEGDSFDTIVVPMAIGTTCTVRYDDNIEFDIHTSADVYFPFYSIPYGTFTVDSCKKQADMTHRKIIGYSNTNLFPDEFFNFLTQQRIYTCSKSRKYYLNLNNVLQCLSDLNVTSGWTEESGEETTINTVTQTIDGETYKVQISGYTKTNTSAMNLLVKTSTASGWHNKVREAETILRNVGFTETSSFKYSRSFTNVSERTQHTILDGIKTTQSGTTPYEIEIYNGAVYTYGDAIKVFLSRPYSDSSYISNAKITEQTICIVKVPKKIVISKMNGSGGYDTVFDSGTYDNKLYVKSVPDIYTTTKSAFTLKRAKKKVTYTSLSLKKYVYVFSFGDSENIKELFPYFYELSGLFGSYERDGTFDSFSLQDTFEAPISIDGNAYQSIWYDDGNSKPIGRLTCTYTNSSKKDVSTSADLVENYSTDLYKSYSIANNKIIDSNIYTANEITAIFNQMAENMRDISYMPSELTCIGLPWVEVGDFLEIETEEGNIKCLVEQRTLSGIQHLTDSIKCVDEIIDTASNPYIYNADTETIIIGR